jgi:hypothetical protein
MSNSLPDLGQKLSLEEVAKLFDVAPRTAKEHYRRYGGVMRSRKLLFFEKLVDEAIRRAYASQVLDSRNLDGEVDRPSQMARHPDPQALSVQARGKDLGSRTEAPQLRAVNANRHGLLA